MEQILFSIIIPAKNEEKRISRTLGLYATYFQSRINELPIEIIVVNSNSSDGTSAIVDEYARKYEFIKKIDTIYDLGKGGAVALGFIEAKGDLIGFVDADGSVSPTEIQKLYDFIAETPWLDGVIGNRPRKRTNMSVKRRLLSFLFNTYVKLFFNLYYKDTQCGVKIFRNKVAKDLAKKLSSTGWAFDVNLLLIAKYLNYRILEHDITWKEKEGSKFSLYQALVNVPKEFAYLKKLEVRYFMKLAWEQVVGEKPLTEEKARPKKLLIFTWRDVKHPNNGGGELYIQSLAKRLTRKYQVTIFTAQPKNLGRFDEIDGVKVIRRGNVLTVYFWACYYYLTKFKKEYDYVVDTENGMTFFTPLYCSKPIFYVIYHIHGVMWFKEFPFPFSLVGYLMERYLIPLVYAKTPVITISPSSKKGIREIGFSDESIFLVYVGMPSKVGNTVERSKTPLLLSHGRLKAYKRVDLAIKVFARVVKEFPEARLIISGSGSDREELENLAKKLDLQDKVDFLGYVSERKKWELMQQTWVFLMTSVVEGWGITVMEAAMCETPSVGFNVEGVREAIRDNLTGYLADDEDIYYEKVKLLLQDKDLRTRMGKMALKWSGYFSWNMSTKVFEEVLESCVQERNLLSDKVYPWDLELRPDETFLNSKDNK